MKKRKGLKVQIASYRNSHRNVKHRTGNKGNKAVVTEYVPDTLRASLCRLYNV